MSETIFLAQNANGACRELRGTPAPKYSGGYWIGERLDINDYPPPGECWEYRLTRKGDIDTDGDPIGWKIVGIGKDGSVLCEKGNGQRRRYSFGDGAKEQPSGEAWEFCQRLVDMVGAEGPEDVQGMLDKVNAELHRLKQNIDSMSANLADKEGFLNSAGDEIQRLTEERDEAESGLRSLSTISGQTIAELRAKLERPEMPEVVRELLAWFVENPVSAMPIQTKLAAVRDYYATPFRIDGLGVYLSDSNSEYAVVHRFARGEYLCAHLKSATPLHLLAKEDGSFQGGGKLTKYLRPLE